MRKNALICATLLSASALTSYATLTREELIELATKDVDPKVQLSLVRKHCVDFRVDAAARQALEGVVPAAVIEEAAACSGGAPAPPAQPTPAPSAKPAPPTAPAPPATPAPPTTPAPTTTPAAPARPAPPAAPVSDIDAVRQLAVVPMTVDGVVDAGLTSEVVDQLRKRKGGRITVIDSYALGPYIENTASFHADGPEAQLLVAARQAGAQAVLIGKAIHFEGSQDIQVRLTLRIVAVHDGAELWEERGRGLSGVGSWDAATKRAVRDVVRELP